MWLVFALPHKFVFINDSRKIKAYFTTVTSSDILFLPIFVKIGKAVRHLKTEIQTRSQRAWWSYWLLSDLKRRN